MDTAHYVIDGLDGRVADLAAVASIYDRIWGQFNARTEVHAHLAAPGFTGRVARAADGTLAGYAYGITARPDDPVIDRIATYLTPRVAEARLFGSFFVSELAVAPEHHRRGLGATLMRAILGACRHDRATTCTEHYNTPARALYTGLGFATLVEHMKFSPQSTSPADDFIALAMPLPLPLVTTPVAPGRG